MSGVIDNKTLLEKADMDLGDLTSDGGLLVPAQAKQFIRIAIDNSVVMRMATVKPMKSHKQEIDKIRFGSRILRAGQEARALSEADRAKADTSKVELDAQLFKAEVRLSDEVLEDNIERGSLRNTVMQLMAERIALDMDEVIVNGDTTSADPFLAQFDGMLASATSNQYDASGAKLSKTVLRETMRTMPTEFRKNQMALKYMTSVDAKLDYHDSQADRETSLGDARLERDATVRYQGAEVVPVPVFPDELGGSNNQTQMIFTDPKNLAVGIWRNVKMETDKIIQEGVLLIVATLRFDFKYVEETAAVKVINILNK